jgi:hypothetical protein
MGERGSNVVSSGWVAHRLDALRRHLAATPEQRVAWLEEIASARRAGAPPRSDGPPRHDGVSGR